MKYINFQIYVNAKKKRKISLYLFILVQLWNKQFYVFLCYAYVNHDLFLESTSTAQQAYNFLLKDTAGAFDGAQTHDWLFTSSAPDKNWCNRVF